MSSGDGSASGGTGFTEREMKLIFERAGEASARADADRRYSLAELQEIATQAGLDANDIARAAATVRQQPVRHGMLGAPFRFHGTRMLGHELAEDEVVKAVQRVRAATGLHGELKSVPGGMEWRARSFVGEVIVDFAQTAGASRVDVLVAREDHAALAAIGGIVGGMTAGLVTGIAVAVLTHPGIAAFGAGVVAGAAVAWTGARLTWTRIARRWARQTEVITEVASAVAEPPSEPEESR